MQIALEVSNYLPASKSVKVSTGARVESTKIQSGETRIVDFGHVDNASELHIETSRLMSSRSMVEFWLDGMAERGVDPVHVLALLSEAGATGGPTGRLGGGAQRIRRGDPRYS
jgi:hypothetical protein